MNARSIGEADWKILRRLEPLARERFCQRILSEIVECATGTTTGSHKRYLAVYRLIQKRDRELGAAFDGLRRSRALLQLAEMEALELLTDEEFAQFSTETQQIVALYLREYPE